MTHVSLRHKRQGMHFQAFIGDGQKIFKKTKVYGGDWLYCTGLDQVLV